MFRDPRWLLAALPLLAAAWALAAFAEARRRALLDALGRAATILRCSDAESERRPARLRLRAAALALTCLALAGPRWGVELAPTRGAARQVVVAVDVSLSMRAQDAKPSRLERAKSALALLIDQLAGDRVGVVAFAGEAQIVCPVTSDSEAAKELLGAVEVGLVPVPGTAVGSAIRTAASMLGRYPGGKAVVLITDGEDKDSDPLGAAREAAAAGVRVYALGVGSPEGEPIPLEGGGYKKDDKGAAVVSRLDEAGLSAVAQATGGAYFRASPTGDEIADIVSRVQDMDRAEGVSGTASRWKDRYAWPLAAAWLLLMAELLLPLLPRATRASSAFRRASAFAALSAAALLAAPSSRAAAWAEASLREGDRRYADGRYEEALQSYAEAAARRPKDPRPVFNAGDALYRLEQGEEASRAFRSLAERPDLSSSQRAQAWYNDGNTRYRAGDFAGAAASFRAALALDPRDEQARRNLVIALRHQRNPPPPKQDPKKDDPKKQDRPQDKKDPAGGQGGEGGDPPPQGRTRPQDRLSREDAERVMRAVEDRQKAAQKRAAQRRAEEGRRTPPGGQDW